MSRSKKNETASWFYFLMFPAVIYYYELVFSFSTVNRISTVSLAGLIYTLLFSFVWGEILFIIRSLFPTKKSRIIYTKVMLIVTVVPFIVEYFVYLQFKVLYDLKTVKGGAGNVVHGFMKDVIRLIFSVNGLTHIFLFFLPALIYFIFLSRKHDRGGRLRVTGIILTALMIIVVNLFNVGIISLNKICSSTYNDEYNFNDAVSYFGLYTGIRLDLAKGGSGSSGFDTSDDIKTAESTAAAEGESSEETTTEAAKPIEYNVMNIDFEALASSDSGTYAELDSYVASLTPSQKNDYTGLFEGKNLIFISAEAFSGDIIDPELTPTLYRLSTKGINFTDYYVPASAGTTGGECENLFGLLPTEGGSSVKGTETYNNYFTMGNQLNRLGYYGYAFHNNSYTMYDRDKTHINLGYSNGFMGYGNGMEEYVTKSWPESDLEMIQGTLDLYIDQPKFNIYYMSVSGHSGYSKDSNAMSKKNWDRVADLDYSDDVKAYIACNLELEDALTYLVEKLEEKGIADDTVIVLSADHFPYGLDDDAALGEMPLLSELYGYNVTNYMQRDHNTLILWSGCLEDKDPIVVDTPTCSIDILPTLSNLFGVEYDSRLLPGRDVFSDQMAIAFNINYDWKTEYGQYIKKTGEYTPNDENNPYPSEYASEDDYISAMKKIVRNKINFCAGELQNDYYGHLFGND